MSTTTPIPGSYTQQTQPTHCAGAMAGGPPAAPCAGAWRPPTAMPDVVLVATQAVEAAIKASIDTGLDPSAMADRVFEGIKNDTFYLLAEEGGSWDRACRIRLDDIRERRNPTTGALSGAN